MNSYNNSDLINLTEFGQYLKSVFEFCILQNELKNVAQIKWNIQWLDLSIVSGREDEEKEYFLEIVIVLKDLNLKQDDKNSIIQTLNRFFTIKPEQPTSREINGKFILITKMHDISKERFTLKSNEKGVPDKFKKYEVTISIESLLRDMLPSAKLILSSDDINNEEGKLINELIEERTNILSKLNHIQKPIVICEGKTDIKIIETAWTKLYPNEEIPFQILPSGTWLEIDKSSGGANQITRLLELYSPINPDGKICIGLFDNDSEGNNQLKGLSKTIFEDYDQTKIVRKHKIKKIFGMLLPVPEFRKSYFGTSIKHRFFVIEHYFSDQILATNNMKGETITPDSVIFGISGDKDKFSKSIAQLDKQAFENMTILFDELKKLISR